MYTVRFIDWEKNTDSEVFKGSLEACKIYIYFFVNYVKIEASNFYILAPDGITIIE